MSHDSLSATPTGARLEDLLAEAGERGATRVLARLGLADESAGRDVKELRELLGAWRDAKASAWKATWHWVLRVVWALLLAGLAVRLGFGDWVK